MARILLFFITTLFCSTSLLGQEIQVFSEDFNGNTHIFTLNSGLVGDNTGNNTWIVNKEYVGTPLYGNTLNQDSVVTGQINGSPFSKYLHIHDSEARINQDIANANFDPTSASDRFAHFGEAVCTKSLFNVTLTFYYLVEGNDNAYGEVWFSKDFGPWQQVGPNKLTNADKWQRLDITDTRFDNTENLRFGFRWVNTSNSGPTSTSLSIDELNVVADYDEVNNPVEITTTPLDDTICRSNPILMRVSLSDSLCEGVYLFEISEPGGSFNNPENLGTVAWGGPPTFFVNVPVPSDYQTGVCYRMRVTRIQPPPLLRSDVSDCFYLEDCRPQISTMQPPVTIGSGPGGGSGGGLGGGYVLCAGSVIDVPFTSVGTILEDNLYIAVLSQEIDTLPNGDIVLVKGDTIGSVPDPNPHPFPPGNVSGKIHWMLRKDVIIMCKYFPLVLLHQALSMVPFVYVNVISLLMMV